VPDKPPRTFEFLDRSIPRLPIPPKPKQHDYFDTKVRGLGLRVSYGGKKSFFIIYGPAAKRQRLTLDEYGRLEDGRLSLAEARRQAKAKLGAVAGRTADPAAEARAERSAATVRTIAEKWIEARRKSDRAKSVDQQWDRLERHVLPEIGGIKGSKLTFHDIEALLDGITDRGSPIMANRIHEYLKTMMGWAIKQKRFHVTHNEALTWTRNPESERDRFLSAGELKLYWEALDDESEAARDCLRLCLLTAQRHQNVRGMRRDQLFLDDRVWRVPASTTKTGAMNKVPLSKAAMNIIERRQEATDSPWLFPKSGGDGHATPAFIGIPHRSACKRAGITGYTIHDHRHSFATYCDIMDIQRLIWDGLLGHSSGILAELYSGHDHAQERRECMEAWANRIAMALGENVIEFERRPA
jgi:integrase